MTEQQNFEEQSINAEQGTESTSEEVRQAEARAQAERFAEDMKKFAEQSTYAAKGFAGFVSERAREFYDEQKTKYQAEHPEVEKEPGAKEFLEQLRVKLNEFVESLNKGFHDMAERGRGATTAGAKPEDEPSPMDQVAEDIPDNVHPDETTPDQQG